MLFFGVRVKLVVLTAFSIFFISQLGPANAANNEAVGRALEALIAEKPVDTGSDLANANFKKIQSFYATRSFKPIWSRDAGPKGKAKALLGELRASRVHGLSPQNYGLGKIETLMKSLVPADLARMDMLFTGALVDFSHDLLNGRITNLANFDKNRVQPIRLSPAQLIDQAAAAGNLRTLLAQIVGDDRRYLRLVTKMVEYQRLNQPGIWPTPEAIGSEAVNPSKEARLAIRRLLALTGDLPLDEMNSSAPVGAKLSRAIASYQERHGLVSDGKLGSETLSAFKVPLVDRIRKIKINLERRRWQNRPANENLLYVNLVDGQLKLLVNDKTAGQLAIHSHPNHAKIPNFYALVTQITHSRKDGKPATRLRFRPDVAWQGARIPNEIVVDGAFSDVFDVFKRATDPADHPLLETLKTADNGITLSKPVPLFFTYLTTWATRDGKIHFRTDIYQRDPALMEAMGL